MNGKQDAELKEVERLYDRLTKSNKKVVIETIIPLINILLQQQGA